MKPSRFPALQESAVAAARAAGALMRRNLRRTKKVNEACHHDIKLDLDVRCQRLITRRLALDFPSIPVLGEEGIDDRVRTADARWVVDPIDGTVNYAHGIPHAAVSIALQLREGAAYRTVVGVVHDPFMDELWTAIAGRAAYLDGRRIHVSKRRKLDESIVSLGFAKSTESLDHMLPVFNLLVHRVRKIRLMGSAALALTYVADGRFDGYVEAGIRLWDIAAGGLIVERAGGVFEPGETGEEFRHSLHCNNGIIDRELRGAVREGLKRGRAAGASG
jgi:myo-inositol-1(or 4)-monophosphatase